jgi:tetratricopeptide (TPR) repeat protein
LQEDEQRKLHQLRKKAGVNRHTFAFLRGRVLAASGEHDQALLAFEQAAKVQVHNRPSLFQHQAESLLALKRWGEAQAKLEEILEIDPVNAQAQLGLSRVYLALKRPRQALDAALASIGLVYHNPQAHFLCGQALRRLGRRDEAIAALRSALSQNPVFPAAHRLLAAIYLKQERIPEANDHRAQAKAAAQRIKAFKAGEGLPEDADVKLDVDLLQAASVAALSTYAALPKLDGETVVVSGLPRSGTSMMMQMLAAGGLAVLTDGEREADDSNPRGYLELEAVKQLGRSADGAWLDETQGKAIKVVAPLLPSLPLNRAYRYRVHGAPVEGNRRLASGDAGAAGQKRRQALRAAVGGGVSQASGCGARRVVCQRRVGRGAGGELPRRAGQSRHPRRRT